MAPDSGFDVTTDDVYAELRRVASRYVRRERAPSVQATELVHEAWLRLGEAAPGTYRNRAHFIAIAAIAMRRLLVDRARRRTAAKRGAGGVQVTLDDRLLARTAPVAPVDLIALDRALTQLANLDADQARVVELRYFGGLSIDETADALAVSPATVKRQWTLARAWLLRALSGDEQA